jgi:hypothetical protein
MGGATHLPQLQLLAHQEVLTALIVLAIGTTLPVRAIRFSLKLVQAQSLTFLWAEP